MHVRVSLLGNKLEIDQQSSSGIRTRSLVTLWPLSRASRAEEASGSRCPGWRGASKGRHMWRGWGVLCPAPRVLGLYRPPWAW